MSSHSTQQEALNAYTNLTQHPQGSIREIWTIAFPLMLTALSGSLMLFLDRLILAHYATDAMTAVAAAGMVCALFQYGAVGVAGIAEVFVGQYNGARQYQRVGEPVWQMLWFSLLTLVIFLPIAQFAAPLFIAKESEALGIPYFKWVMSFGPMLAIHTALAAFFIGLGKVKLVTIAAIIGNIANVVLDLALVFGITGWVPALGTTGAAIATVLAQILQVVILFAVFLSEYNRRHFGTSQLSFNLKMLLQCLKVGGPNAIGHMIEIGGWALLINMMAKVSSDHLTVAAIGQSVFILWAFATDGLQKGVIAVASNFMGAKQFQLLPKMLRSASTAAHYGCFPDYSFTYLSGTTDSRFLK